MYHEKWGFLVIFWNFAGVPFVGSMQSFLPVDSQLLHPSPMSTQSYTWPLTTHPTTGSQPLPTSSCSPLCSLLIACTFYRIRSAQCSDRFVSAGIPLCRKRADSRCRPKVSSTIVKLSLNFREVPSRILPSFRPLMGSYFSFSRRDRGPEAFSAETVF